MPWIAFITFVVLNGTHRGAHFFGVLSLLTENHSGVAGFLMALATSTSMQPHG
jgi:hypothetical protein